MKNLLFPFCLLLAILVSGQQNHTNTRFVNSFVKEWLESSGSKDCALKYLEIHDSNLQEGEKKKFFFEWFSTFSKTLKAEITLNNGKYQIIPHKYNHSSDMITEFNLKTEDYTGVFYVVVDNKVITSIIVRKGKIISYCPMLNQGSKINKPWFTNAKY